MTKPLFKMLAVMVGIICLTVGAGFALSDPAPEADAVVLLKTAGMTCGSCAARIDTALRGLKGVDDVQVDVGSGKVLAAFQSQVTKPETIADSVSSTGYQSSVMAVLTMAQYKAAISGPGQSRSQAQGGCGGDCCNKTRK